MIRISNKLLKKVLEIEITHFAKYDKNIFRCETPHYRVFINIYELANKCKEWALANGYNLWSGYAPKDKKFAVNFYLIKENIEIDCDESLADTEVEAIFKACEWILKQKLDNSNNIIHRTVGL